MKRYAVFAAQFALAPMISGTFVTTMAGPASPVEWGHIATGFALLYLILVLLLKAFKNGQVRIQAGIAMAVGLLEAIPDMPRLHALTSPVLFATLAWAVFALRSEHEIVEERSRWIFALPALVLLPIFYGVGYRHQTSGFLPHIGLALLVAGTILMFCVYLNEHNASNPKLRRASNLTIAALLFQVVFGIAAFIIRLLNIDGGLSLAISRTAHITGGALVLAASLELAIQYRRSVVEVPLPEAVVDSQAVG